MSDKVIFQVLFFLFSVVGINMLLAPQLETRSPELQFMFIFSIFVLCAFIFMERKISTLGIPIILGGVCGAVLNLLLGFNFLDLLA